ncbi:hypothetical protein B296_00050305 [Ensete ventricosum]|uniref:Uncharacterized protein n=1 Tax=Ensete ventricosum TaxID=4639 RepID=A0A426XUI9_ENSVE|nr:hypothetical protein B296_00050305 [Ensete ventricosum]
MKKCDGHKVCVKSRSNSSFDRFFYTSEIQNSGNSQCIRPCEGVRARFHEKK